jgi:peptidoglycan/LPS O-acetylase OafA/YrhL
MKINKVTSEFLDFLRWFSAFVVVFGHIRRVCFVPYSMLENKNILIQTFYFLTGYGHAAVIVFFVLSGFLVGGQLLEIIPNGTFTFSKYFIKRVVRLYTVLIGALLVSAILDYIRIIYFQTPDTLSIFSEAGVNRWEYNRLTISIGIGNFFMLQESITPVFGSNSPLWSLAYEFWYYFLMPFLMIPFFSVYKKGYRIIAGLLLISICILLSNKILLYFLVWVIGALTSLYKKQLFKSVVIPIFFMLGSLIVYRLVDHTTLLKLFTVDLLLGVGLCFLLHYYYTNEKSSLPVWMGWIPNVKLADFSYTLYLVHYPFLFFVSSYLYTKFNGNYGYNLVPNLINILYYVTMIILIYIYSYVMYLLFEKQTKRVRDYLLSKYG